MARPAPTSTYRLQFTPEFTFRDAEGILPYLRGLGIDWVYCSPIMQAAEGSTHGYDVVDPNRVDQSRGGREAFESLATKAHEIGLGVLVDIVPNHQGIADPMANPMWKDLLTHGEGSHHDATFDVDWRAGEGKVLIPVLGDDDMPREPGGPIGNLTLGDGVLRYHDTAFPIAPGTDEGTNDPNEVHRRQHYRLMHWRQGDGHVNYRRFFTITSLAGVRVENPRVFDETHAETLRLVREGFVDGLRIDHIDGLRDPEGYLRRLQEATGGVYITVEKILEFHEELPASWPVAGTTGYEAIAAIDRVLVNPEGEDELDALARETGGDAAPNWLDLIHGTKRDVAEQQLLAEIHRITRDLIREGVNHPQIVDAVTEFIANLGVYRTYLPQGADEFEGAERRARERRPDLADAFNTVLPPLKNPDFEAAKRLQQSSGMVMAKGVEDRAFFRDSRLTSLNEVGGDPSLFSISLDEFHERMRRRQETQPESMNALSTHDTKRGEDARARIHVISEAPERWREAFEMLNDAAEMGDDVLANLIWQAIVGVWPASQERIEGFVEKAARESGMLTSWTKQDAVAEKKLRDAAGATFKQSVPRNVVANAAEEVEDDGWTNALSAKLIQLTMPGVPDVYQGTELWSFTLTDPDNRFPVDYEPRKAALSAILKGARPDIDESGAAKLLITAAALLMRRERRHLFTGYEPVEASGEAADHLIAFNRGGAITLATRFPRTLREGGGWGDTKVHLPGGDWVDQLTSRRVTGGRGVSVASLFSDYPVALLARS